MSSANRIRFLSHSVGFLIDLELKLGDKTYIYPQSVPQNAEGGFSMVDRGDLKASEIQTARGVLASLQACLRELDRLDWHNLNAVSARLDHAIEDLKVVVEQVERDHLRPPGLES
jgi:hypothetical protein